MYLNSLDELRRRFIQELNIAVNNASNEEDYEDILEILYDLLGSIPYKLALIDFIDRKAVSGMVIAYGVKGMQNIDKVMKKLMTGDRIMIDNLEVEDAVYDAAQDVIGGTNA